MTFPMAKTPSFQSTLIAQAKIKVQEASPREKKEKETLVTFPIAKPLSSKLTFITQAKNQVQEVSPKEKKEKGTLVMFPMAKRKPNLNLPS